MTTGRRTPPRLAARSARAVTVASLAVALAAGPPGVGLAVTPGGTGGVVGGPQLAGRGLVVNYPSPQSPRVPRVPADAFVIADATTGQVLAAKDPHGWYGPASTLKILTAISLIPVLNPAGSVIASKRAVSVEPDVVGLKLGHSYKIADLFRALLMISGNDAAIALAEATGSLAKGVALLNAQARELQADDTVAVQPNGLDAADQHTSAYDEALIARRAVQMPAFLGYDETLDAWFPITPRHRIELINQDRLLTTYPGFLGGKTGWTTPAEATYVGMARRGGRTLIVTLLHAVPGTLFTSATAMLNWGFRMDGKVRPVGWLVGPRPVRAATAVAARARAATRRAAPPASAGIALPFTVGTLAFAALALGSYAAARRRRQAHG